MAWVGYAALAYKKVYNSTKYDTVIAGVARYLLTLRNAQGLIKGGPDVNWVSTQHNLLAAGFPARPRGRARHARDARHRPHLHRDQQRRQQRSATRSSRT